MNKCNKSPLQWIYGNMSCFLIIIATKRNFINSLNHCQTFYNASIQKVIMNFGYVGMKKNAKCWIAPYLVTFILTIFPKFNIYCKNANN
jgi:hypothetical protein